MLLMVKSLALMTEFLWEHTERRGDAAQPFMSLSVMKRPLLLKFMLVLGRCTVCAKMPSFLLALLAYLLWI